MPSTNLYCETWELYETTYKGVVEFDSNLKKEYADIKEVPKVIRVYGTKDEIKKLI